MDFFVLTFLVLSLLQGRAAQDAVGQRARAIFDVIDTDDNAILDINEVAFAFVKLGEPQKDLEAFLAMMPQHVDGSGFTFQEFEHWYRVERQEAKNYIAPLQTTQTPIPIQTTTAATTAAPATTAAAVPWSPCSTMAPPPLQQQATTRHGHCPLFGKNWGNLSVCLNNQKVLGFPSTGYMWHCPWESMMLVSTKTYGGCPNFKYDCQGTDVAAVLELYKSRDTLGKNHAPEGSLETVEYVMCCIRHQCRGASFGKCGDPPWIPGKSVSPWVANANPCGAAGCERRYDLTNMIHHIPQATAPIMAIAGICSILAGVLILARRRSRRLHAAETNTFDILASCENKQNEQDP